MAGVAAIPAWVKIGFAAVQAAGTLAKGAQAKANSKAVARQMESDANRAEAVGQREYLDQQREGRYIESALLARAGASGAGVSDVTVEKLRDDVLDQSLYNAMTALYNGDSAARSKRWEAQVSREEGRQAMKGAAFEAIGDLGASAFSQGWFDGKPGIEEIDMASIRKYKRAGS